MSNFGPQRLLNDLLELGYSIKLQQDTSGNTYCIIERYEIETGKFCGRVIDLGILVTPDYPISVASSIHVRVTPQLYEYTDTISGVRNITHSLLGPDWRYWSKSINLQEQKTTKRLLHIINGIFDNA